MTIRQRLHDLADAIRSYPYRNAQDTFSRLNPTLNGLHPNALLDSRAAHALEDENDPYQPPAQRRRVIADRAIQAQAIASKREHDRQDAFAQLNPDFGVLPDSQDPEQHRFAQQRERALALGQRVTAAEQPVRERGEPSAPFHLARPPAERQGAER
jgi:DICT domain-containing protein